MRIFWTNVFQVDEQFLAVEFAFLAQKKWNQFLVNVQ
jgi:hypothetical protein